MKTQMVIVYILIGVFILSGLVFYFLTAPSLSGKKRIEAQTIMLAHRGLHNDTIPENSSAAFKRAVDAGWGIELDIRLTADGKVVVFHDDTLERLFNDKRKVSECCYDELPLLSDASKIPLLSEVLELIDGKVLLLVELKGDNSDSSICSASEKILADYKGKYYIESFNPFYLRWFRKNQPEIVRGQLATRLPYLTENTRKGRMLGFMLTHMLTNFLSRPHFIAYDIRYSDEIVLNFCRDIFKTPIFGWTVRGKEEIEKAQSEYEGIIFEIQ